MQSQGHPERETNINAAIESARRTLDTLCSDDHFEVTHARDQLNFIRNEIARVKFIITKDIKYFKHLSEHSHPTSRDSFVDNEWNSSPNVNEVILESSHNTGPDSQEFDDVDVEALLDQNAFANENEGPFTLSPPQATLSQAFDDDEEFDALLAENDNCIS